MPRGTAFTIRITAEGRDDEPTVNKQSDGIPGPAPSDSVKKLLEFVVDVLESGAVSLGGRTGSGQGTIQVIGPKLRRTGGTTDSDTLTAPADVLDTLIGRDEEGTPIPLELGGWSLEEPHVSRSIGGPAGATELRSNNLDCSLTRACPSA